MGLRKSWSNRPLVILIVIQYGTVVVDARSVCQTEHPEYIRYLYGQSGEAHSCLSLIYRIGLLCLYLIGPRDSSFACRCWLVMKYVSRCVSPWVYLFFKLSLTSVACYSISLSALLLLCFQLKNAFHLTIDLTVVLESSCSQIMLPRYCVDNSWNLIYSFHCNMLCLHIYCLIISLWCQWTFLSSDD